MTGMINFDTEIDTAPRRTIQVVTEVPVVTQQIRIHQQAPTAFLARRVEDWTWSDLRDYVVTEIEKRFGVFPRDPKKEMGIFKAFLERWGSEQAAAIARYAFEVQDGRWRGAPIRIQRFCKGSDDFFARPISEYLAKHT